jgi:hypothetical protein
MRILLHTRLSWFFIIFFFLFLDLALLISGVNYERGELTLLTVNSLLYGFYIAPIMTGQKTRIDDLARIIRSEANALFDLLIKTKKLPRKSRNHLQDMLDRYIQASFRQRRPAEGEDEYEALITYCLDYDGKEKEVVGKILDGLVANQQNRSQLSQQLSNKVFSNEWLIMIVLFSITTGFVLMIATNGSVFIAIVKALLCTGLSMLMISLLKLSTLTHKRAKNLWAPLDNLSSSHFRRID